MYSVFTNQTRPHRLIAFPSDTSRLDIHTDLTLVELAMLYCQTTSPSSSLGKDSCIEVLISIDSNDSRRGRQLTLPLRARLLDILKKKQDRLAKHHGRRNDRARPSS